MRIEGQTRTNSISARSGAGRGVPSGAIFSPEMGSASVRAANVSATAPAAGIEALLALQAVEDPLFAKKKAVRRGTRLLDALESIRTDLIMGHINEGRLNLLMALVSQARERSEPGLDSLLDDIELRARVELAKFGRFPAF